MVWLKVRPTSEVAMAKDDEEYKKQLWEFFAEQGGVKGLCMASAQGWYIRKENEFRKLKGLGPLYATQT